MYFFTIFHHHHFVSKTEKRPKVLDIDRLQDTIFRGYLSKPASPIEIGIQVGLKSN